MAQGLDKDVSELSLFNASLRAFLECPVCYDFCKTPIYMCSNGHHICNKCQPSLTQCPTCRVDGRPSARSLPLEKIVDKLKMPCANKHEGCEAVLDAEDMAQHWETCREEYTFFCNISVSSETKHCEWSGDRRALVAHVKEDHPGSYSEDDVMQCDVAITFAEDTRCRRLVSAHGELFWVTFWFDSQQNTAHIYSLFVGRKENAADYRGKFVWCSNDRRIENTSIVDTDWVYSFMIYDTSTVTLRLLRPTLEEYLSEGVFSFAAQILKVKR